MLPALLPQNIEFRETASALEWRYVGQDDDDWQTLIEIDDFAATVEIGTVSTLGPGEAVTVVNVGTARNVILDIGIPAGSDGLVQTVLGGSGITVDSTDPNNPTVSAWSFATLADAAAFDPSVPPDFTRTAGYAAAGDVGGALYALAESEPSHAGKYEDAVGNWYELVPEGGVVTPEQFGAEAGGSQTASDRRTAIQAAIDYAAEVGAKLDFSTLSTSVIECDGPLFYNTGNHFVFGGIDITVFKLSDDAGDDDCVWEPATRDGSTTDVVFEGGFTVDGNYARSVAVTPSTYPNASGFITAGAKRLTIIGGIKAKDCKLHGLDICSGGETTSYVDAGNKAPTYYPANMSSFIRIDYAYAENCGDDNLTGHYSHDVHIGAWDTGIAGLRHSDETASNGFEVDDGCFDWHVGSGTARGGNRGLAIKSHSPEPAPYNIHFGDVVTDGCRRGVYINGNDDDVDQGQDITIQSVTVRHPEQNHASDTSEVRGFWIEKYKGVFIGSIKIEADGDESLTLETGVLISNYVLDLNIGAIDVRNWPYANTSNSSVGGVRFAGTCSDITIGSIKTDNCGYRGVVNTGAERVRIGTMQLVGASLSSSIALRMSSFPRVLQCTIGPFNSSGFTTATSYDTSTSTNTEVPFWPQGLQTDGMILAGVDTIHAHHRFKAAVSSGSLVANFVGASDEESLLVYGRGGGSFGVGSGNSVVKVTKDNTTSRSIAAAGTINASGADYAEYHQVVPHLEGNVAAGEVLGFNAEGLLTDIFDDVTGPFVVKSTHPYGVGGDAWSQPERICKLYGVEPIGREPSMPVLPKPQPDAPDAEWRSYEAAVDEARVSFEAMTAAWAERVVLFEAALEAERRRWDRIAKTGYVPVNTEAAPVGHVMVPRRAAAGGIDLVAVAPGSVSLPDYLSSIGRVIGLSEDGRPLVEVKTA
jgi:hypothetical protein